MHVIKPGTPAPDSGTYEARKDGEPVLTKNGRALRCTLVKDRSRAPAAPCIGVVWVQVGDTNPDDASSRP